MVSLSRDAYLVNTRNYPSLTIQVFVKVLLHSVVQEASVRIGIKRELEIVDWYFIFIECYISHIRSLRYSGL